MEKQIEELMNKYGYFNVDGNILYWHTGRTSGRVLLADITSIDIKDDMSILKSDKGTEFGYHEVIFTASGASFTETLENVVYYN